MDVRSYSLTVVVFEPGVNGTFIVKSRVDKQYSGYAEGELLDVAEFREVVSDAVKTTILTLSRPLKKFYVGVPGEFLKVAKESGVMSLGSARRVTLRDCDEIMRRTKPADTAKYAVVSGASLSYTLSDDRNMADPVGEVSNTLKAELCFYRVKRSFITTLEQIFGEGDFKFDIELIPTVAAEAVHLMSPEKRDSYTALFDFGHISSSLSVVRGNGVVYSRSFSIGAGHMAYYLTEELGVPYDVAWQFLEKTNLNVFDSSDESLEVYHGNLYYSASADVLRAKIREAIDIICEQLNDCMVESGAVAECGRNFYVTGEGVRVVRGFSDHLSSRLEKNVIEVVPQLPCYDRPECSSLTSLMYAASKSK